MTHAELCDKLSRVDAKLDMLCVIFAHADSNDVASMGDGLCFTVQDVQSELSDIRAELCKHAADAVDY